jgi:hypothetical protein
MPGPAHLHDEGSHADQCGLYQIGHAKRLLESIGYPCLYVPGRRLSNA